MTPSWVGDAPDHSCKYVASSATEITRVPRGCEAPRTPFGEDPLRHPQEWVSPVPSPRCPGLPARMLGCTALHSASAGWKPSNPSAARGCAAAPTPRACVSRPLAAGPKPTASSWRFEKCSSAFPPRSAADRTPPSEPTACRPLQTPPVPTALPRVGSQPGQHHPKAMTPP